MPTPTPTQAGWMRTLSRAGFATKGFVYVLIGGLAVLAAIGEGGRVTGSQGAVRTLGEQPFGRILLIAVAVGLMAYAAWALAEAIFNVRGKRGIGGIAQRLAMVVRSAI